MHIFIDKVDLKYQNFNAVLVRTFEKSSLENLGSRCICYAPSIDLRYRPIALGYQWIRCYSSHRQDCAAPSVDGFGARRTDWHGPNCALYRCFNCLCASGDNPSANRPTMPLFQPKVKNTNTVSKTTNRP